MDGFDPKANGIIEVVVVQPDGKILIGGEFTTLAPNGGPTVTRNRIARLNANGSLDTVFNPNANQTVIGIAVQPDGKILAGGFFSNIGGQPRKLLARLDPTTGLADSFDPNVSCNSCEDPYVQAIVVQADGKILIGGKFEHIGPIQTEQTRHNIARLDPATAVADSFDPNADFPVHCIVVQADGRILTGGEFTMIGGQARNHLARLNPITGLADTFNPNGNGAVFSIALQADGKIVAGGTFTGIGGASRNRIARLDTATGLADSFDPDAGDDVYSVAVQPNGKVLVGGAFTIIGGQTRNRIARFNPITGLADSFNPNSSGDVYSLAVQQDGKILAAGAFNGFNSMGTQTRNRIARLEIDGRVDQTLDPKIGNGGILYATAIQPDGKILIGGLLNSVAGASRNDIARLNSDGTLDSAFNPNANNTILCIAATPEGKVFVGGSFTVIGGQFRSKLARLDGVTGLADSFDAQLIGSGTSGISSIAQQPDGKILVGGDFTSIGGQMRNGLARLDPNTALADSFDPNPNGVVSSIVVLADGKILVAGSFTMIGGQPRNRNARLDPDTGLADSFDPNADSPAVLIPVQADGKIMAYGDFQTIGGQPRHWIARLNETTGMADSFDPHPDNSVTAITVQTNGQILAGGTFLNIGAQPRHSIARLDPNTALADAFNPSTNSSVSNIVIQADGKILLGGGFNLIGGRSQNFLARVTNDVAALQELAATQTTITWTRGGASAQFNRVTFEFSTDNVTFVPLGNGAVAGRNWILPGLNLPLGQNFYVRARGFHRTRESESITESVRNVFLDPNATPTPTPAPAQAQPLNISTRLRVQTGNNVGVGGFIINGNAPKTVVVRGIGPSLTASGLNDVLADPTLELRNSSGLLVKLNDNWQDDSADAAQLFARGLALQDPKESGIFATLQPNASYTAILAGKSQTEGVGLIEIYDANQGADSELANISTRGFVLTDNNVMIGGFILGGNYNTGIVVRGIGPSLAQFGLNPVLADPTLELHDSNGATLITNDNWQDDPASAAQLITLGLAPQNVKESALVVSLPPGAFTAILAGKNAGTGIGLVEIYNVH